MSGLELLASHPLLIEADATAAEAHARAGQLYAGQPYIVHPRAVAALLAQHVDDVEVLAAALLHDTLEDTYLQRVALENRFGSRVARLVDDVTAKPLAGASRRDRVRMEAVRLAVLPEDSQSLKCADIAVNLHGIKLLEPRFALIYVPEKREIANGLTRALPGPYSALSDALGAAESWLLSLPTADAPGASRNRRPGR